MSKPDDSKLDKPVSEDTNDIGDFKAEKNSLLDGAKLTDHQFSEEEKRKSQENDPAKQEPPVKATEKKDEALSSEDDFVVPGDEGDFKIDDPLDINLDENTTVKKVEEKPPVEDDITQRKGENLGLRDALKEANDRAQQATGLAENLRGERDDLKKKLEESQVNYDDVQSRLSFRNPTEHPEVTSIVAPWDKKLNTMAEEMNLTGENGTELKTMAPTLVRLMQGLGQEGSEGYADRKNEIISSIEDHFPDDKKDVVRLISEGARTLNDATAKINELKSTGSDYEIAEANKQYNRITKAYDDISKGHFNPSSDLIANDPLNPKVILHNLIDIDPQVKAKSEQVSKFVRYASLPLPPPNAREIAGMDDDAAANYLQNRTRHHSVAQERFQQMATEAMLSHACLPSIYKMMMDAKDENKEIRMVTPKPNEEGKIKSDDEIESAETGDVKEFAVAPTQLKFE